MIVTLLLLFAGLLLIFLEFFLPGGIIGAIGGILLLLSLAFFVKATHSLLSLMLYIIFVSVAVFFLIKLTLLWMKKTKKNYIYLSSDQEGYLAAMYDANMIGKEGVAISDLKPSGHILIENKRLQALSKSGYILKGTSLRVIGGRGAYLIVKTLSQEE